MLSQEGRDALDRSSVQEILHELLVHQVELEMQNEELQQARDEALLARESYRQLFDQAPYGNLVLDESGIVLNANAAAEEVFNVKRSKLLNRPVMMHILSCDHVGLFSMLDQVFRTGEVKSAEFRIRDGNESVRTVSFKCREVNDPDFSRKCLCTIEDISIFLERERQIEIVRRSEQKVCELQASNRWLRHIDEVKSDFLSSVSHELRTPLSSVLGFAKLIRRDFRKHFFCHCATSEIARRKGDIILRNLDIIQKEGERLGNLIEELLDLRSIESGKMAWNNQPVDLHLLMRETVDALQGLFMENTMVKVVIAVQTDLPTLYLDPQRMEQVFTNLLTNAFKNSADGMIAIKACAPCEEGVIIQIEDQGVGMNQGDLLRIFEKFYQGKQLNPSAPVKGTGLGLPISKTIIEHYGGLIWAESSVDRGTTVTIELPVGKPAGQTE